MRSRKWLKGYDLQVANSKSGKSVATQGEEDHSANMSMPLCGFDGDDDNDDNDIGGDNELSSIANQNSVG